MSNTKTQSLNQQATINRKAGQRIRLLRKILGLNQEKLGSEIGVTQQQVQNYETGRGDISLSRLEKICEILKTEPANFLKNIDNEDKTIPDTSKNRKALKSAIIAKKLEMLPLDTINKIDDLITALAEYKHDV